MTSIDHEHANSNQHCCQTNATGHAQEQPAADTVEGERPQQYHQYYRTGYYTTSGSCRAQRVCPLSVVQPACCGAVFATGQGFMAT
jgi:hypothetical protein